MIQKVTFFRKNIFMLVVFLCTGISHLYAQATITSDPVGASVCVATSASFSVGTTGATGFQWEVSTNGGSNYNNITNGSVYANATTATLSIINATTNMSGYMYRVMVTGSSGTVTSSPATLTVNATNTWNGSVSNAWNVPANWSCGSIPTAATDVVIPSGSFPSPQVNITNAIANNITINSGASLSFVAGSNMLEVKGNFTNNGTFTAVAGKLKLSGSGSQTVPAATYKDFELSGSGTKVSSGAINISGVLTLTSGFLQLGASDLTLGNSASIAGANALLLNPSPTSYIITNSTGRMRIQNIGTGGKTGAVLFPIGNSSSSYTPLTLQNAGTVDIFSARVRNGVYLSYDASDNPNGPVQNTYNVGKSWLLAEGTAGGSNATINFAWASTDEQPGFNNAMCWASHWRGGYWHSVFPGAAANGTDPYSKSISNISSFSPFAVGSQFSILPVDLVSFSGKATKSGHVLSWTTSNEINFAGFTAERSADGNNFEAIGTVAAQLPGGVAEKQYSYTDINTLKDLNYYRLRINDLDGRYKYSNVVAVNANDKAAASYSVYPNPVHDQDLVIRFNVVPAADGFITITDIAGRILHNGGVAAGSKSLPVNVKKLPAGIYQIIINCGTINEIARFTKQ